MWTKALKLSMLCAKASRKSTPREEFENATASFNDWNAFVEACIREGLACFVRRGIVENGVIEMFPPRVLEELSSIHRQNFTRNAVMLDELNSIVEECNRRGFEPIIIGSIPLFDSVFDDISLRPLQDIDLLVLPAEFAILQNFLPSLGYQNVLPYPNLFKKETIFVDLHTEPTEAKRIPSVRKAFNVPLDELRKDSRPFLLVRGSARALSLEDALILTSLHNLKHCYYKLTWTFDAFCLTDMPLDWEKILDKCRRFHTSFPLLSTLHFAHNLFGAEIPDRVMQKLAAERVPILTSLVLKAVSSGQHGRWGEILTFLLTRSTTNGIKFALEFIFPSRQTIAEIFGRHDSRIPLPLLIIYYLRRALKAIRESLKSGLVLLKEFSRK